MIIARVKKIGSQYGKSQGFGDEKEWHYGIFTTNPKVGERFHLQGWNLDNEGISTSPVQKILKHNKFATKNSYYQLEFKEMPFTYACYKFYDSKGRRLAIFGLQLDNTIEIVVIPCNLKDDFSFAVAKNLYYKYRQSNNTSIIRPGLGQDDFLRWCSSNYGRKITVGLAGTILRVDTFPYSKQFLGSSIHVTYVKMPNTNHHFIQLNPVA